MIKLLKIIGFLVFTFPLYSQDFTGGTNITTGDPEKTDLFGAGVLFGHYSANDQDNGLRYGISFRIPFLKKWEGSLGGGAFSDNEIDPDGGFLQVGVGRVIDIQNVFYIVPGLMYYWHKSDDSNLKTDSFFGPYFIVWHDLGRFRYGGGLNMGYMSGNKFFLSESLIFSFDF